MKPQLFRALDADEEATFREWAREHYQVGDPINATWHPVVQLECAAMNEAAWRADPYVDHLPDLPLLDR